MAPPRPARVRTALTATAAALALAVAALAAAPAAASGTRAFRQATAKDFEEGELTGTTVLPTGEVAPGLLAKRSAVPAAFVWCAATGRDGGAYFGTGDEGKIFSFPANAGPGAPPRLIATLDAPWVTALAVRGDGTLLAATTPGGRIFAVDVKSDVKTESKTEEKTAARVLAKLGEGHVWALARDDRHGVTYAGTGAPGRVVAVEDSGKTRQIWDAHDKHVVALVLDGDGTLLAGTSDEAILYRIKIDGHAEVLQDFEAEEVRAIVRAPSGLYAAVNDFEKSPPAGMTVVPSTPVAAKGTKIVIGMNGPPASAGALPRQSVRKAKSAVYRFAPDGRIEQVLALPDTYLTALAVADDGSVLAAAGTEGHVYRVTADGAPSLAIDLPERQALALARSANRVLVGTGDAAGIYRAEPATTGNAQYLSKVLDAEFPARWGTLHWLGTAARIETRSGNTAKPDRFWNDWKPLDHVRAEPAGGTGHVASPSARYVQYRAHLASAAARLRDVTTHYLPQNQRARITELGLGDAPAATTLVAGALSAAAAARSAHSPILKLRWKVDNADGDELVYRLSFREPTDTIWRPIGNPAADPLTKTDYDWNTEGLPDGVYIVRVTASDERAEPRERALTSTFDSLPLLVDNRKPEVNELAARYPTVTGRARDAASPISLIEVSIDGGEWRLVAPDDGIADDLAEPFTVHLPALAKGPHAIAVRATDGADNVGAAEIMIKVP